MTSPKLNEMMISLIKKTGSPVAPLIMQKLSTAISDAKHLFPSAQKAKVEELQKRLLKDFSDAEINQLCTSPEFITTLLILLKSSIISFTAEKPEKTLADIVYDGMTEEDKRIAHQQMVQRMMNEGV